MTNLACGETRADAQEKNDVERRGGCLGAGTQREREGWIANLTAGNSGRDGLKANSSRDLAREDHWPPRVRPPALDYA